MPPFFIGLAYNMVLYLTIVIKMTIIVGNNYLKKGEKYMRIMKKMLVTVCLSLIMVLGVPIVAPVSVQTMPVEAATKIKLNKKKATIYIGKSVQLKIKGTKAKVKWTSNKKSVAKVSSKGKVTGKKAGKAVITAKVKNKKYKCTVTVKNKKKNNPKPETQTPKPETIEVTGISLNQTAIQLNEGENAALVATVVPYNATDKTVFWMSSNTNVATVNNGVVTGISAGTATIIAATGNNKFVVCTVNVKESKKIPEITYADDISTKYDSALQKHKIFFSLKLDDKSTKVASSGISTIKITNKDNEVVFEKEIPFSENNFAEYNLYNISYNYLCCIDIDDSDIEKSRNSSGILSLTIKLSSGKQFDELSCNINNLPVYSADELCKVIPPEPDVVAYYHILSEKLKTMCMVSGAECNVTSNGRGGFNLDVILSGVKTYDSDGEESDSPCRFRLKLYKDNQVIDYKLVSTPSVYVGERFSNLKQTFYGLEEGTYEMILTDY